jgi:hypothetical protein
MLKKLDYNAIIDEDYTWNHVTGKRETYYLGMRNDLCEGKNRFKKIDYNALVDEDHWTWNQVKLET